MFGSESQHRHRWILRQTVHLHLDVFTFTQWFYKFSSGSDPQQNVFVFGPRQRLRSLDQTRDPSPPMVCDSRMIWVWFPGLDSYCLETECSLLVLSGFSSLLLWSRHKHIRLNGSTEIKWSQNWCSSGPGPGLSEQQSHILPSLQRDLDPLPALGDN